MRRKAILGVAAAIVVGVALIVTTSPAIVAQSTGDAKFGSTGDSNFKTSWGEPDLEGLWSDEYQIPLQRPAKYAGRAVLTDEEVKALDEERARKPSFGEKRAERGTEADVAGAYDSGVFLTRRHTGKRTSLIVDPPDGRIPPFTPEKQKEIALLRDYYLGTVAATETCKQKARGCEGGTYTPPGPEVNARRNRNHPYYPSIYGFPTAPVAYINRADGPEDRGLQERCMVGVLPDFDGRTGNVRAIVQSPGVVSMFYDTGQGQGWHRIIPTDGSPHLPASVRLWWGDSRGRWEGNTLVIDVTNFSPRTWVNGSRQNLHLVERWTRTGPKSLEYIVTIEDSTTWTKPWTVKQEMTLQSAEHNRVYKEPRCHEGNVAMTGLLAGARAAEREFAAGKGPDPSTINTVTPTNAALGTEDLDDLQ